MMSIPASSLTLSRETTSPFDLGTSLAHLRDTLGGLWLDTLAHFPAMIVGLLALLVTWLTAHHGARLLERYLDRRHLRRSIRELILRFALVGVWVVGIMLAAMLIFPGLTPTKALGVLGVGSVAIGFAFKDIFENFLAGILILWRFPFEIGDTIACEEVTGVVERITLRNTLIRLPTDTLVILPNSRLFKNPLHVLTEQPERRIGIVVGVAYDEDLDDAVATVETAVRACKTVSDDKGLQIFPRAFGSSSVDIEVEWWTTSTLLGVRRSRGEVISAVKRSLDDAGIEIPFPYRTITFKEPLPLSRTSRESRAAGHNEGDE